MRRCFIVFWFLFSLSVLGCSSAKKYEMEHYSGEMKDADRNFFFEQFDEASKHYESARKRAEALDWVLGVVRADRGIAKARVARGDAAGAEPVLTRALELCKSDRECSGYMLYEVYGDLISLVVKSDPPNKRELVQTYVAGLLRDSEKFNIDEASIGSLRQTANELDDSGFRTEASDVRFRLYCLQGGSCRPE